MRNFSKIVVLLSFAAVAIAQSQTAVVPQTARQALLDMFFGKTPGTFVKHLPAATIAALDKAGALAAMQQYSTLAGQLEEQQKGLEIFETGRILVRLDDPKTGKKFEMSVENDSLRGDQDEIEVSFETYKDRQPQRTPFLPRMTFVMKSEAGVWKLNEISVTVRVGLSDPDFLKTITDGLKSRAAAASSANTNRMHLSPSQVRPSTNDFGSEAEVIASMRSILGAEKTYSSTYRATGYTCMLSDLDGFGGGEPNEHQAMLLSSSLAGGRRFGYTFTLSACTGSPANGFHLAAAPAALSAVGRRAYCADQSGAMRYSTDGNAATCFASGAPLP